MKKRTFKMTSLVVTMTILLSLMLVAISMISVSAEGGYVFQDNFNAPANNGFAWYKVDTIMKSSTVNISPNDWTNDGANSITYKATGGVTGGCLRRTNGSTTTGVFYHAFTGGAGADVTVTGSITMSDARVVSVIIYKGTTKVAQLGFIAAGSQNQSTYLDGTTKRTFSANSFRPLGGGWFPFKIVLKWDGSKYASADYYIGNANINSNTAATLAEGFTGSLANATQTSVNKFGFGEGTQNGTGANLDLDNVAIYVAQGVTLPNAGSVNISGTASTGKTLTGSYTYGGTFTELKSTTQWQQADPAVGTYTNITGETSNTLLLTSAYTGKLIRWQVITKDVAGNIGTTVYSDPTSVVAETLILPTVTVNEITGTPRTGQLLTGSYSYSGEFLEQSSLLQWQVSLPLVSSYSDIAGATLITFIPTLSETGKCLRLKVTPRDETATLGTPQFSPPTAVVTGTLNNPSAPSRSGKIFSWMDISGSSSYTLVLSKTGVGVVHTYTDITKTSQDCTSIIDLNGAGTYSATVQAIGDGTDFISSAVSASTTNTWYGVTYYANTAIGSVPIDGSTYSTGSHYTIKGNIGDPILTKTGYTFSGWATAAGSNGAGSGTFYKAEASVTMSTANISLYATWVASTLTVTYDAGGGTGTQIDSNLYAANVSEVILQGADGFVKEGYTLSSWVESGTGTPHDLYSKFIIGTSNVRLIAQWTQNAYLDNLTSSVGEFTPAFTFSTLSYSLSVLNETAAIRLTPTGNSVVISITVNGISVISGTASGNITLIVGDNVITIEAMAQNYTVKVYTLTVTRMAAVLNKVALQAAIEDATTLINSIAVGTDVGNVPESAKVNFQLAITTAIAVNNDLNATQADVDVAVAALATSTIAFNNAIITVNPKYSVTGMVSILSGGDLTKASVVAKQLGVTIDTVNVLANGTFTISLEPGIYTFEVSRPSSLKKIFANFTVSTDANQTLSATAINLVAGDVVVTAQNTIDLQDLQTILTNFGSTSASPSFNTLYDLNDDSFINLIDLQAVLKNFGSVQ